MKRKELEGKTFGTLYVEEWNKQRQAWKCVCTCGNVSFPNTYDLTRATKNTVSCRMCRNRKVRQRALTRTGFPGYANKLYYIYKRGAELRDLSFDLSIADVLDLSQKLCTYCGRNPSQRLNVGRHKYADFVYNGIDRLNNDVGYTKENCVACCGICNMAKRSMSYEQFMSWIYDITIYNKDKICL